MTFERIQQILGLATTNEIAAAVLEVAHASEKSDDPRAHRAALRELLTALLAVLVASRSDASELDRLTEASSQRLVDLIGHMVELESAVHSASLSIH